MDKKELEYFNICNTRVHIKGNGEFVVEEELMYLLFKDEKLLEYFIFDFMQDIIKRCIR